MDFDTFYDIVAIYPDKNIDGYYMAVEYHRDMTPLKNQWDISVEEEFHCFAIAKENKWFMDKRGWGIHPSGVLLQIGHLTNGKPVKIARFREMTPIGHAIENKWHGYPADIKGNNTDIPVENVLKDWLRLGIIKNHQFAKIRRGLL